jgi:glucokinase
MSNKYIEHHVLTADVGGSHITTAVCNLKTNSVMEETVTRVEFDSKGDADAILNAWLSSFSQSADKLSARVTALGVAMPGPFDYENGISYIKGLDKYDSLYGQDIKTFLSQKLHINGSLIKFRNDTEALIAGEVANYFGSKFDNIVGISLGTGFGNAHYANGATHDLNWGALPYKASIADDYFSTRWFLKRFFELTGERAKNVKELSLMNTPIVTTIFKEFAENLGNFLAEQFAEIKPEALVVCGNIAKAHLMFLPELKARLSPLHVELGRLGENAALLGAASLFSESITIN